jgi:hypothetical protein
LPPVDGRSLNSLGWYLTSLHLWGVQKSRACWIFKSGQWDVAHSFSQVAFVFLCIQPLVLFVLDVKYWLFI